MKSLPLFPMSRVPRIWSSSSSGCCCRNVWKGSSHSAPQECTIGVGSPGSELEMLEAVESRGMPASRQRMYVIVQECTKRRDIMACRRALAVMMRSGLGSIPSLSNPLIRALGDCGHLQEADDLFRRLSAPTVHSWNAILSAYLQQGSNQRVLALYQEMLGKEHVRPDVVTFLFVLKACGHTGCVIRGHLIHDRIMKHSFESNVAVSNSLIDMYCNLGSVSEANSVFGDLPYPTLVSWGAMILGYSHHGEGLAALRLFQRMRDLDIHPDKVIFLGLVKACASICEIDKGRGLHHEIISLGLDVDEVVSNSLLDMYAKCGRFDEARNVFEKLSARTTVSWGALIGGYVQHGYGSLAFELFERMQASSVKPDKITYLCVLRACGYLGTVEKGRSIHENIRSSRFNSDIDILNAVIDMYGKCHSVNEACEVFNNLPHPNVMSWESLIGGYVFDGNGVSALQSLRRMFENGFKPTEVMLSYGLQACAISREICQGRIIHHELCKHGCASSIIGNTLVDMYAKCGSMSESRLVFEQLSSQNAVSWSALMSGYVQQGHFAVALDLFQKMRTERGILPNKTAFSCAVKACGRLEVLTQAKHIHEEIVNFGYESEMVVGSSLVDMYVRCKHLEEARQIFDNLPDRDLISWASMVSGYVLHDCGIYALDLYKKMQADGMKPDKVTFLCLLKACGSVGSIKHGDLVFDEIIRDGFESDAVIGNALIDMYVKCGRLESAENVSVRLCVRNVVASGAIISGYAQQGNFEAVQSYLDNMSDGGVKPDHVIFTNILSACSHTGKLVEGQFYFRLMKEFYGIAPNAEQYSCMIDLLGRAGCFEDAEDYLDSYPGTPDFLTWVSLLSSCRLYGNVELGMRCFDRVSQLNTDDASGYVLMTNIYVESQLWEEVKKMEEYRRCAKAWKKPGMAWIEVDENVHEFVVGGHGSYPSIAEISSKLTCLNKLLKGNGYWPQLDSVMEPMT